MPRSANNLGGSSPVRTSARRASSCPMLPIDMAANSVMWSCSNSAVLVVRWRFPVRAMGANRGLWAPLFSGSGGKIDVGAQ